jgi:hypothetical protein
MKARYVRLVLLAGMVAAFLLAAAPLSAARTVRPDGPRRAVLASAAVLSRTQGTLLVNQPATSVCVGHTFTVGVWFQRSGGSRAYRVAISGPRHVRFFYRHGLAPSAHWQFWKIRAGRRGTYITTYSGHWRHTGSWDTYRAITRARRC